MAREVIPNRRLAAARKALLSPSGSGRPMSRQELADACNAELATMHKTQGRQRWAGMTEKTIGALERGEIRWPNEEYRQALCTVLNADERSLGLYIDRATQGHLDDRADAHHSQFVSHDPTIAQVDQPQRHGLAAGSRHTDGGEVAPQYFGLAQDVLWEPPDTETSSPILDLSPPRPGSVGWSDVEHLRFITRAYAISENTFGGAYSGQAAAVQLRQSARLIEARADNDVRHALLEVIGNLSAVVGFSAFDIDDFRTAKSCFEFALWCAKEAKSWPLRASALSDLARLEIYLGRPDEALSLIELAQVRSDRISATTRAMLYAIRARLLAAQGRLVEAIGEVACADQHFADRRVEMDPPWMSYYDEAEHQGSTGRALIPAAITEKNPTLATGRLKAAINLHDKDHPRSRAFSRIRLATLIMQVGDPREAAAVGQHALDEATGVRSTRLNLELGHLGTLAMPHRRIPEVAELRHEIMSTSREIGVSSLGLSIGPRRPS